MDLLRRLPGMLLQWYDQNRRDLPWRYDREPYHIWLSEIMLQQTRVEAVKGYYARFLDALPTIADLAACPEDKLYKLWEGLGYYSRVRNLKKAARCIVENGGEFPRGYAEIRALPGIGDYTAGAIASICFDEKTPAVDGNVLRVMSRLRADDTPIDTTNARRNAAKLLSSVYPDRAGDFTQALMELGATVCGPNRAPDCAVCPLRELCRGYAQGIAAKLPVKTPKKEKKRENRTVFILSCQGKYALRKRPDTGILARMWEFPNVDGLLDTDEALAAVEAMGLAPKQLLRVCERRHIFTHIRWDMRGVYLEVDKPGGALVWMTRSDLEKKAALPTAFRQFLEDWDNV